MANLGSVNNEDGGQQQLPWIISSVNKVIEAFSSFPMVGFQPRKSYSLLFAASWFCGFSASDSGRGGTCFQNGGALRPSDRMSGEAQHRAGTQRLCWTRLEFSAAPLVQPEQPMGMPAPEPGMVEDTQGKCCGLDPESKGLLKFCALDISPL